MPALPVAWALDAVRHRSQVASPKDRVVCVMGDYSFGWNGLEIETASRYNLPILFVVANNRMLWTESVKKLSRKQLGNERRRYSISLPGRATLEQPIPRPGA